MNLYAYRRAARAALASFGLVAATATTAGAVVTLPPGTPTFLGPATFTSGPAVATTVESGTSPVVAPSLLFPELDPPAITNLSNGFDVHGRFDFLNGTGTSVELTYTVTRLFTLNGSAVTTSALDGNFGIESSDIPLPIGGGSPAAAHLDGFRVTTEVLPPIVPAIVALPPGTSFASDFNETIPLTLFNFPTNSYHSGVGPVTSLTSFTDDGSTRRLIQTVDISISGLIPGEAVDIALPTTSTIGPAAVPEPAGLVLFGIGGLALGARIVLRRRPAGA